MYSMCPLRAPTPLSHYSQTGSPASMKGNDDDASTGLPISGVVILMQLRDVSAQARVDRELYFESSAQTSCVSWKGSVIQSGYLDVP